MIVVTDQEVAERIRRLSAAERAAILAAENWPNGGPTVKARLEIGAHALVMQKEQEAEQSKALVGLESAVLIEMEGEIEHFDPNRLEQQLWPRPASTVLH